MWQLRRADGVPRTSRQETLNRRLRTPSAPEHRRRHNRRTLPRDHGLPPTRRARGECMARPPTSSPSHGRVSGGASVRGRSAAVAVALRPIDRPAEGPERVDEATVRSRAPVACRARPRPTVDEAIEQAAEKLGSPPPARGAVPLSTTDHAGRRGGPYRRARLTPYRMAGASVKIGSSGWSAMSLRFSRSIRSMIDVEIPRTREIAARDCPCAANLRTAVA